jgi:uncharacterized phage protein gp47/JayE
MPTRNFEEIRQDLLQAAVVRGIASYVGAGGTASETLTSQAYELARHGSQIDRSLLNAFLSSAFETGLDRHGEDLDLQRNVQSRAFTRSSDRVIRFYVENGTFESNGVVITDIVSGIQIFDSSGSVAYLVNEVESLGDFENATEIYVGAQAIQTGVDGNIAAGGLRNHTVSNANLKVTNRYAISNGRDRETDTAYRARLEDQVRALEACNDSAIRRNTFVVAGIGKVNIIVGYRGAGSVGIIVQPSLGVVAAESLLESIRQSVTDVMPHSSELIVKAPEQISVSIESVLRTSTILNATEKLVVVNRIRRAVLNYFNDFQIGDDIVVSSLADVILRADARLVGFGSSDNRPDLIRTSITDGISSYDEILSLGSSFARAEEDELFVIAENNPFTFTVV